MLANWHFDLLVRPAAVIACSLSLFSFRQSQRNHRLTPSDDELLQKTTIHHLERESPNIMFIENYTNFGFSINGNTVVGPCAILPEAILQWNVSVRKHHLIIFLCLPLLVVLEIVVLGTGGKVERLDPDVLKCLQQRGIAVEVQSTDFMKPQNRKSRIAQAA
ncbi:hypothetical protein Chor_011408 [Crotalus horridus]